MADLFVQQGPPNFEQLLRATLYANFPDLLDISHNITGVAPAEWLRGARGDIWIARCGRDPVALKTIQLRSPANPEDPVRYFTRELRIWRRLSHPNILEFLGVCDMGPHGMAMVAPWMHHGHIGTYLASHGEVPRAPLVMDIAQGLSYLHNQVEPIVHGDLKPNNILIRFSGQACLADFGLSRLLVEGRGTSLSDRPHGNLRWLSPERLFPDRFNTTYTNAILPPCDVYAFGLVIHYIFTGLLPFSDVVNEFRLAPHILDGHRPAHQNSSAVDSHLWPAMEDLARACWVKMPQDRPEITHILRALATMMDSSGLV